MSSPPRYPQLAVVTGAGSGIGLATALGLLERGTTVVGVDVVDRPETLRDAEWVLGDVTLDETWHRVRTVSSEHDERGADCLVCCAARIVVAPFLATTLEDWRRLFELNVLGVIRGMQTLVPAMLDAGRGSVAVVCSVNSLFVEDEMSAYSTSKAALLHVVRSAALEYASHGVRINAVCPGAVDTPLLRRHLNSLEDPEGARDAILRRTPTGEIVRPEEVANAICFLVSDEATAFSGAAVTVDGGLTTAYDFDVATRGGIQGLR